MSDVEGAIERRMALRKKAGLGASAYACGCVWVLGYSKVTVVAVLSDLSGKLNRPHVTIMRCALPAVTCISFNLYARSTPDTAPDSRAATLQHDSDLPTLQRVTENSVLPPVQCSEPSE